jgi:hypothetical protein
VRAHAYEDALWALRARYASKLGARDRRRGPRRHAEWKRDGRRLRGVGLRAQSSAQFLALRQSGRSLRRHSKERRRTE